MAGVIRRGLCNILSAKQKIRHVLPLVHQTRNVSVNDDGDSPLKTTINFLNKTESGIFFETYSQLGFRLNSGLMIIGPCAVFPRSILHWNVQNVDDISEESLSLFTILEPKLDILVIGVGERECLSRFNPKLVSYLRSKRIGMEILPTDQAIATFNFLNSEKRYVAGAMIPPSYIQAEDDLVDEDDIYLDSNIPDVLEEYKDPDTKALDVKFKTAKEQFFNWKKESKK